VLSDLIPGRTYYFYVVSSDSAGNIATNGSPGNFLFICGPLYAACAFGDQYTDSLGLGIPPISGYTAALDQAGVKYDLWSVAAHNGASPRIHCVPTGPSSGGSLTLRTRGARATGGDQQLLASGGGLFVASMEILSRLEGDAHATNFIRNVLQVQAFRVGRNG